LGVNIVGLVTAPIHGEDKFIGVIKSEAKHYLRCLVQNMHSAFGMQRGRKGKCKASMPLLLKCITQEVTQKVQGMKLGSAENENLENKDEKLFCKCCMKPGHATDDLSPLLGDDSN